jgi:GTP pyrophosphokinase
LETVVTAAPIVRLVDESVGDSKQLPGAVDTQAAERSAGEEQARLVRARAFAEPLLAGQLLDTGEDALHHAEGVVAILRHIGASPAMLAAVYLVYVGEYLAKPRR